MVNVLRCNPIDEERRRVVGKIAVVVLLCLGLGHGAFAQQPGVHYLHHGAMPPGAIGSQQLQRGGPLPGFFQPVEIKAPSGTSVSLAVEGHFHEPRACPSKVGMLIGQVYRLRLSEIPLAPGREVFPTVEIIDRVYAPRGQEQRFSIPIQFTQDDLRLALDGKFVTRVVYLEDPESALPIVEDPNGQNWFEVGPGKDPLAVADALGRPVAILRLGGRVPEPGFQSDPTFFYGSAPLVQFLARPQPPPAKAQEQR